MDNLSYKVVWQGHDITSDCLSYERTHNLCDGVGTLVITTTLKSHNFIPYNSIYVNEGPHIRGTYYVVSVEDSIPSGMTTVVAQDASKKLSDYFVSDITETGDAPSYTRYWIEKYLDEAGVSYAFDVADSGTLVSNNSSFGRAPAMDIIIELLKQSGWYLHTDYDGIVRIGRIEIDMSSPDASYDDTDIISVATNMNDSSLRNQVIVWGNGDSNTGDYVFAKLSVQTPWDRDAMDIRKVGVNVAGVRDNETAAGIASSILKETKNITFIKDILLTGLRDISIGDTVFIESDYYTGAGIVTTLKCSVSPRGAETQIILDERCERIVGYYDFGDFVYVGTNGAGVWRKHIRYDHTWYDYSQGLTNLVIPDLTIRNGVAACVDGEGNLWTRYSSEAFWVKFSATNRFVDDAGTLYSSNDVTCVACTINKTDNHIMAVFNLNGQVSPFVSFGVTYYQVVGSPKSWLLDMTTRSTFITTLIATKDYDEFYSLDIDHNGTTEYIPGLEEVSILPQPSYTKWLNPNQYNSRYGNINDATGYVPYIYKVTTGQWGIGNKLFYLYSRVDIDTGVIDNVYLPPTYDDGMGNHYWLGPRVAVDERYCLVAMNGWGIVGSFGGLLWGDFDTSTDGSVDHWSRGALHFTDEFGNYWSLQGTGYGVTLFMDMGDSGSGSAYTLSSAIWQSEYKDPGDMWKSWHYILEFVANRVDTSDPKTAHMSSLYSAGPSKLPFPNFYFTTPVQTASGFVGLIQGGTPGGEEGVYTFSAGSLSVASNAEVHGSATSLAFYSPGNDMVYFAGIPDAEPLDVEIRDQSFSVVYYGTNEIFNIISTSTKAAVAWVTNRDTGANKIIGLYNSEGSETIPTSFSLGRNGNDSDGSYFVYTSIDGINGIYRYDKDFLTPTFYVDEAMAYPSVFQDIILSAGPYEATEGGSIIMNSNLPLGSGANDLGTGYLYGIVRPNISTAGEFEHVYFSGLEPRVDCSQGSPLVVWGDGPAHGWMYLSDTGDLNDYHLVDPGYTTGFMYFGPRCYNEMGYGGGSFSGGSEGYYRRILYPHANSVWNYDADNEIMWDQGHYTDDPEEGLYYDFGFEVKAVETSNYQDTPFMFVACSGESGPLFYQKDGYNIGFTADFTWDDYSAGLPAGDTGQILTIRIDDRN